MKNRKCIENCGFSGTDEDFPLAGKDGYRSRRCRACKQAYDRSFYHNKVDKKRKAQNAKARYIRNKKLVAEYLEDKCCKDCGEDNMVVLEFDHLEEYEKVSNIADLAVKASPDRLMSEIAKCDVVCANCHRIRTWMRQGGSARIAVD